MLASSEDAVLRAEQSLASAGITDGAILPGVYEGSGEGSKLVADGTRLDKETVKASIRIELAADGTFVHTETVDERTLRLDHSWRGFYARGEKTILDPSRERGISMRDWLGRHSELEACAVTALHSLPRQTTV